MYQCNLLSVHLPVHHNSYYIIMCRRLHRLWVDEMEKLLTNCQPACDWFIEFLSGPNGEHYLKLVMLRVLCDTCWSALFVVRPFLLECSSKEVRYDFCSILGFGLQSYCTIKDIEVSMHVIIIMRKLGTLYNDINYVTIAFVHCKGVLNHVFLL